MEIFWIFFKVIMAINIMFVVIMFAYAYYRRVMQESRKNFRYIGGNAVEIYEMNSSVFSDFFNSFSLSVEQLSLTREEIEREGVFLLYATEGLFFFYLSQRGKRELKLSCASRGEGESLVISSVEWDELQDYDESIKVVIRPPEMVGLGFSLN